MSSLLKLEAERERLLLDLEEAFGETTTDDYDKLVELERTIQAKTEYYLTAIKDKRYVNKVEELKSRKKEIDKAIKQLESLESFIKQQLHSFISENGGIIPFESDGVRLYAKPDTNYTTEIVTSQLEPSERTYKVTCKKVSEKDFLTLQSFLEHDTDCDYTFDLDVGVKDLDANHKALVKTVTPTIKITKSK